MHLKKIVFLLVCFLFSFFGFSQKMNISGVVFDTTGKKTLANVSVLTVRIKDSLLLMSTRTKPDGSFSLTKKMGSSDF